MSENIADGRYTIEVDLNGGSGRAGIESPTLLTIVGGKMEAEIEWSSSNYDYMKVEGKEYHPVYEDGHSVFQIDISSLDAEIPITAETVAMSKPHMIEYTLYFDSSTIRSQNSNLPFIILSIGIAAVIITFSIFFIKRKRKNVKT